jgi:hypothetical protein
MAWGGFPQARGSGCQSLIVVDALFPLDQGRREGKKRERETAAGYALLDVLQVAGVRCN